jgi:hypothetical protein
MNIVHDFLPMNEYGTLKPIEVVLTREWGKTENNGEDEPNQNTLGTYMEMSQQNLLYAIIY